MRNKNGCLILDGCEELERLEKGRKEKCWLKFNNKEYLFKTGASGYEIWAELISSELAKQCNLNTADYDLAIYKGNYGVVTPSFLIDGDIILSGEDLYKYSQLLNPNMKFDNSIENIINILRTCTSRDYDIERIRLQLTRIWLFDGLIYESDRNFSNWSIIINGNNIRMAPIYDCSTMCMMNNNVNSIINNVRTEQEILNITDSIKYQLKRKSTDDDDNFLHSFSVFCTEEPEIAKSFIDSLNNIDFDKVIEIIEKRIDIERKVEIPWECKFWINKLLTLRIRDLKSMYEYASNKVLTKQLKY